MRKFTKPSALLVLATTLCSSPAAFSETCYSVGGKVKTVNLNESIQSGTIKIDLTNASGDEIFISKGQLNGYITGAVSYTTILLKHVATLKDGSSFETSDDVAELDLTVPRAYDENGPCSFYVKEHITNITMGTGFFDDVESVDIMADGYISYCLQDKYENKFVLSGEICVN